MENISLAAVVMRENGFCHEVSVISLLGVVDVKLPRFFPQRVILGARLSPTNAGFQLNQDLTTTGEHSL